MLDASKKNSFGVCEIITLSMRQPRTCPFLHFCAFKMTIFPLLWQVSSSLFFMTKFWKQRRLEPLTYSFKLHTLHHCIAFMNNIGALSTLRNFHYLGLKWPFTTLTRNISETTWHNLLLFFLFFLHQPLDWKHIV